MSSANFAPERMRPEVLAAVERLNGDDLTVLHRILLKLEKERLWRQLSAEFEADAQTGKYVALDTLIREARTEIAAR